MELNYVVKDQYENQTVAKVLIQELKISHRLLTKLKMNEKILINGIPVFSNHIVQQGDNVTVKIDFEEDDFLEVEPIPIEVLYEDEFLLAVNKPAGMVVHPSANHLSHTLANGVKYYLHNHKKIRAINRLDRDTSGIVLFAKNEYIQEFMVKEVKIEKEYIAIIVGILKEKLGTISLPIQRKKGSIMEREVSEEGQNAITHYEVLKEIDISKKRCCHTKHDLISCSGEQRSPYSEPISIVKLKLETGRTHQIRVHMAYMGTPILGDTLYGKESSLIERQALHAYHVQFIHPITNEIINVVAPIPKDMENIMKNI